MVVLMMTRDKLFKKFGPILLEAVMIMAVEETNRLRSYIGMPLITKQNFIDEIENHLSELEPYDWMKTE